MEVQGAEPFPDMEHPATYVRCICMLGFGLCAALLAFCHRCHRRSARRKICLTSVRLCGACVSDRAEGH